MTWGKSHLWEVFNGGLKWKTQQPEFGGGLGEALLTGGEECSGRIAGNTHMRGGDVYKPRFGQSNEQN